MGLKKCETCPKMYGKADDNTILKHCSHCHSDSHWKEHTDWRTKDTIITCPVLKKEKKERRNKGKNAFKKKTVEELKQLPWEMLKQVKEHRLNKVCLNSISMKFIKEWKSNIEKEIKREIKERMKSKKSKKNKRKGNNEPVFMSEPDDKKFHLFKEPIVEENTTIEQPNRLRRQLTGISWAQIAK